MFRVEAENYVRFGTNLASAPKMAWGNILFFRDHNLFLEAMRWCLGALPRFQAPASAKFGTSSGFACKSLKRKRRMSWCSLRGTLTSSLCLRTTSSPAKRPKTIDDQEVTTRDRKAVN